MAELARERVGFIGAGTMGGPVVGHLLDKGYPVTVFARRPEAVAPLVARGARAVTSPRAVAEASDVVFTMVTGTADVEQVVFGPDGVAAGLRTGGLVIDMSTIAPEATRGFAARLAAQGAELLDAPVSGGPEGARKGTLSIMAGGSAQALDRARPLLAAFSSTVFHMGHSGAGQVTKACHQLLLLITAEGVAESLALAARAGVDPGKVREVCLTAMASSRVLDRFGALMAARTFEPGIPARIYKKDLQIVRDLADAVGAVLPAGDVVRANVGKVLDAGRGDEDLSVLITTLIEGHWVMGGSVMDERAMDANERGPSQPALPFEALPLSAAPVRPEPIRFIRHHRARRYLIRVDRDGRVRVTIPRGGSRREAEAFARRSAPWIARQRALKAQEPVLPAEEERRLRALAHDVLPQRLMALAAAHDLAVSRISIRNPKARWGSCSRDGHICLSWRLVRMPDWARDYVLIHELMHLKQMNHSPAYWALVAAACPDYDEARRWLRAHGRRIG